MLSEQKVRENNLRWLDTCNTKDMNAIASLADEWLTPNYSFHYPNVGTLGREGLLEFLRRLFNDMPDLRFNAPDDVIVQGDKVAVRRSLSRTDPASGKRQTCVGMYVCHYSGEKITEAWEVASPWQDEA